MNSVFALTKLYLPSSPYTVMLYATTVISNVLFSFRRIVMNILIVAKQSAQTSHEPLIFLSQSKTLYLVFIRWYGDTWHLRVDITKSVRRRLENRFMWAKRDVIAEEAKNRNEFADFFFIYVTAYRWFNLLISRLIKIVDAIFILCPVLKNMPAIAVTPWEIFTSQKQEFGKTARVRVCRLSTAEYDFEGTKASTNDQYSLFTLGFAEIVCIHQRYTSGSWYLMPP